jgi:hypothetical protein
MVFSKEEKEIWANSEVMHELERIAQEVGMETPEEAFLPIGQDWEGERSDEEKLMDALNDFEQEDKTTDRVALNPRQSQDEEQHKTKEISNEEVEPELTDSKFFTPKDIEQKKEEMGLSNLKKEPLKNIMENAPEAYSSLIGGLTKLAAHIGKQGKVIAACRIEDTIRDIRIALREAKNG